MKKKENEWVNNKQQARSYAVYNPQIKSPLLKESGEK